MLRTIAQAYDAAGPGTPRADTLGDLYLTIVRRLRALGWTYGSCQGTIHHLGFAIVSYYDSVVLMREALREAGLLAAVRADLTWLVGFGRLRRGFDFRNGHGSTVDILNTNVRGMFAVALLQDGEARQVGHLRALSDWLSRYLLPTDGIQDGLKVDGTTFHHVGCYPDYARDGFSGVAPIVYLFSRGPFRVTTRAHAALRRAALTLRIMANALHWPIPLSGRKPEGTTGLSVTPYQWLAIAGTPGGRPSTPRSARPSCGCCPRGPPTPSARSRSGCGLPGCARRTAGGSLGVQLRGAGHPAARRLAGRGARAQPLPVVDRGVRGRQLIRPLQHLRPHPRPAPGRPRHQPRQRLPAGGLRLEPPPRHHHRAQAVGRVEGRSDRRHRGDAVQRGGVRGRAHDRRARRHVASTPSTTRATTPVSPSSSSTTGSSPSAPASATTTTTTRPRPPSSRPTWPAPATPPTSATPSRSPPSPTTTPTASSPPTPGSWTTRASATTCRPGSALH